MAKGKLLVVAPRFPAINQSWIDTYMEQLLCNQIEFCVYTTNANESVYGEKVDRLRLREHIVDFDLANRAHLLGVFLLLLQRPYQGLRLIVRAIMLAIKVFRYGGGFLKPLIRSLQFVGSDMRFQSVRLIHAHEEIAGFHFLLLARLINVPFVLTFHGLPPVGVGQLSRSKRRLMYDLSDAVIVNTRFAKEQVMSIGAVESRIHVLPQGLPLEDFPFCDRGPATRGRLVSLLTVGRFHRDKGQRYALVAIRRLLEQGLKVSLDLVGVGPDLRKLQALVQKLQITDVVRFSSGITTEQLAHLYRSSDFFLFPSITNPGGHVETQGVALQEAQASGCIPVASKTGGIPECVNDGVDAMLIPHRSSRAIASAVLELVDRPDVQLSMRRQGRRHVEQHYAAEVIGRRMAELLRSLACV